MPPNEEPDYDVNLSPEWSPSPTPHMIQTPPTETSTSDSEHDFIPSLPVIDVSPTITLYGRIHIPVEQNLRDLLLKVTETENLEEVRQVKLKVIARDVSLQHLSIYTPNLTELILDGSVVTSLRDLGCGLTNLKILRVNRCGLTSFDGLFGLQTLEELHAADNELINVCQCTSLPDIKVLDVRRNTLRDISVVSFLTLCEKLEHLLLEGNTNVTTTTNYKNEVKRILPNLHVLDNEYLYDNSLVKEVESDEEDDEAEEIIEDKDGNVKEIYPISFDERGPSSSIPASLPPIRPNLPRPATTEGGSSSRQRTSRTAPQSARDLRGERVTLPNITQGGRRLSSPSSLTSGAPICGNVAAALRSRFRHQHDAWREE